MFLSVKHRRRNGARIFSSPPATGCHDRNKVPGTWVRAFETFEAFRFSEKSIFGCVRQSIDGPPVQ
jgi:hypothetical protein